MAMTPPGRVALLALSVCLATAETVATGAAAPVIGDLLTRYERGEIGAVVRDMTDLPIPPPARRLPVFGSDTSEPAYVELVRLAPAWIAAAGPDAAPRRRLVAAAFALELAYARQDVPWRARYPLVVWACELLRADPTRLPGERWWHLASIAILEDAEDWRHVLGVAKVPMPASISPKHVPFFNGADRDEFFEGHLAHVGEAFRDEPRVHLADIQYAESLTFLPDGEGPLGINGQQTSPAVLESLARLLRDKFNASPPQYALDPRAVEDVLDRVNRIPKVAARYAALTAHEPLRGDVELRQGFLRLRLEDWAGALAHLEAVPRVTREAPLVSLSHHFRGWILEQTDRPDAAIAAYREALAGMPRARSTSLLLAAQLTKAGQVDEAYGVLDLALKARPAPDRRALTLAVAADAPIDPWPRYKRGDALLLSSFLERLRESLR